MFRRAYEKLNQSTLQLSEFSNTHIEGSIHCGQAGVLYTSIPQDGNWTATVDGQPVEPVLVGDAMVALILPEGEHSIAFTYENKAFNLGWKISLGCAVCFLAVYLCFYRKKPNSKLHR